jgi:hypothetical protein
MYIGKAGEATEELYRAPQRLIRQPGAHKISPPGEEFTALIQSETSALLIARYLDESGGIKGILNLTGSQII